MFRLCFVYVLPNALCSVYVSVFNCVYVLRHYIWIPAVLQFRHVPSMFCVQFHLCSIHVRLRLCSVLVPFTICSFVYGSMISLWQRIGTGPDPLIQFYVLCFIFIPVGIFSLKLNVFVFLFICICISFVFVSVSVFVFAFVFRGNSTSWDSSQRGFRPWYRARPDSVLGQSLLFF